MRCFKGYGFAVFVSYSIVNNIYFILTVIKMNDFDIAIILVFFIQIKLNGNSSAFWLFFFICGFINGLDIQDFQNFGFRVQFVLDCLIRFVFNFIADG